MILNEGLYNQPSLSESTGADKNYNRKEEKERAYIK
jgi:hypothetical protein